MAINAMLIQMAVNAMLIQMAENTKLIQTPHQRHTKLLARISQIHISIRDISASRMLFNSFRLQN